LEQGTGGLFRQNGLEKARDVKQSQQNERDAIDRQISSSQSNIERLRKDYSSTISSIESNLSNQISILEQNITKTETEIANLQNEINSSKKSVDDSLKKSIEIKQNQKDKQEEIIKQNKNIINENNKQIENLIELNKQLFLKINETDVGTFKFFAKNFNLELDKTVNWFIVLIILVFDPLAVTLLLCFNHIIGSNKPKKQEETAKSLPLTTTQEQVSEKKIPKEEEKLEFGIDDGNNDFPFVHEEGEKNNSQTGIAYKAYPKPNK